MKDLSGKKILIIEDDVMFLNLLSQSIKKMGAVVYEAKNGDDGLKLAEESFPDLVILDVILPNQSGIELLRHLRKKDVGKNLKVIVLTSLSVNQDNKLINDFSELYPSYVLEKSENSLDEVLNHVEELC